MVKPRVGAASQTERLVSHMGGKAMSHGQTVRADVAHLRIASNLDGVATLYFCNMRELAIREMLEPGDGLPLPADVEVEGLEVERDGIYDIRNALITSNGRISMKVDGRSRVELSPFEYATG